MATSETMTDRTIEEYLKGATAFNPSDDAILNILDDRGIAEGTPLFDLTRRERELCKADLYMWCATLATTGGNVRDADGNWSHEEGSTTLSEYDKRQLRRMALAIYSRYGETMPSSLKLEAVGMRLWRQV